MRNATMTIKEMKKAYTKVFQNIKNVDVDLAKELLENVEIKLANEDGRITSVATFEWLESAKNALNELLAQLEPIETVDTTETVEEVATTETETVTESIDFENVKISMGKLAKCTCCENSLPSKAMIKVDVANRGGRVGYVCPDCADKVESYYTKNYERIGNGDTWTFGNEFECINPSVAFRSALMASKYIPTSDSSLGSDGIEFISPIFYGFKSFHKLSETIEHLLERGDVEINERCGTHIHIGHTEYLNAYSREKLFEFFPVLFKPLSDAMRDNVEMTEALFGRYFNDYAYMVTEESDNVSERYYFVNCRNEKTIEWRLAKYVNRKQYDLCVKVCKEFTSAIINNFLKNYNDSYKNNLHKAEIAGGKLVKLFNKFGKQALEIQAEKECA